MNAPNATPDVQDVAFIVAGFVQAAADAGKPARLSIDRADILMDAARALAQHADGYHGCGVFAYDVAEPFGAALFGLMERTPDPSLESLHTLAAEFVASAP